MVAVLAVFAGAGYQKTSVNLVGAKKVASAISFLLGGGIIFIILNGFLTDYYMGLLSEEVEKIVLGSVKHGPKKTFWQIIGNFFAILKSIPFMVLILILNFIPILGQLITFYYAGLSYLNFSLERRNHASSELKKILAENRFAIIGFGLLSSLALITPPFTLIYRPLNVVGGTLLAIEKVEKLSK